MSDQPEENRYIDPVVRHYMQFVDRTLLRENLKLTPEQRILNGARAANAAMAIRNTGRKMRKS